MVALLYHPKRLRQVSQKIKQIVLSYIFLTIVAVYFLNNVIIVFLEKCFSTEKKDKVACMSDSTLCAIPIWLKASQTF